jgi:hypothetical protein
VSVNLKKLLMVGLSAALLVGLFGLAGCGGGTDEPADEPATETPAEGAAA